MFDKLPIPQKFALEDQHGCKNYDPSPNALARTDMKMEEQEFIDSKDDFDTLAIHAGQDPNKWNSLSIVPPIVTSTIFEIEDPDNPRSFKYGRYYNPTRHTLEECLAALDGGKHAITFASGLAAITVVTSLLKTGEHILTCDNVYGGTKDIFRKVTSRSGIDTTFVKFTDLEIIKKSIQSNTKMIWIESPTNPIFEVYDIAAIAKIAKDAGDIMVAVDNSFLTSYLQQPLDLGADIVVYSLGKFTNGHSDVIMGGAIFNDDKLVPQLKFLQNAMGAVPSPYDCYLVNRSLKTLAVRMERHKTSSLTIANWLLKHPLVDKVMHPGLPSHPQYAITKRQTRGHSGVFSFVHNRGCEESRVFLKSLKVFTWAASLGGCESLAEWPSMMSQAHIPIEERLSLGITDSLIRLSVGLEDVERLIKDLDNAFKRAFRYYYSTE